MAPKAPRTIKKIFPGLTCAPVVMDRRFWTEALVLKDYFWTQVEKNKIETDAPLEQLSSSSTEAVPRAHQTPLMDHIGGEGTLIYPSSVLRMRVEKGDLCWSDIGFEEKS